MIEHADGTLGKIEGLPSADVVKFNLADEKTYCIVRPSGTEPKIKFYIASSAENLANAEATVEAVLKSVKEQLGL